MAKMGRKPLEIDENLVRSLAEIQCTMGEMSAILGCHEDTLRERFSGIIKEGKESGKCSLRRAQYKAAMAGNVSMLIWLGKVVLNQREEVSLTSSEPEVRRLLQRWEGNSPKVVEFGKAAMT